MDILTSKERSRVMGLVKAKDTKPELRVRRALHALGYRYRLHGKDLPGKPDIVFRKYRTVVFIHGCFWHRHYGCKKTRTPKSNQACWVNKFADNMERDKQVFQKYVDMDWKVVVIWECETETEQKLEVAIKRVASTLA